MEQKPTIKTFKKDAIISIQVGTGLYKRLQQLLVWLTQQDIEKAVEFLKTAKDKDPSTPLEAHLLTVITLIYGIEEKAAEQGLLEDLEIIPQK